MSEHHCLYKWSEVKAARKEGRPSVCYICGSSSDTETQVKLAELLGQPIPETPITIADGTRGMERGR